MKEAIQKAIKTVKMLRQAQHDTVSISILSH
jgi:hypothetical protein